MKCNLIISIELADRRKKKIEHINDMVQLYSFVLFAFISKRMYIRLPIYCQLAVQMQTFQTTGIILRVTLQH